MRSHESAIIVTFSVIMISFPMAFVLMFQAHEVSAQRDEFAPPERAPVAVSGSNIYTAWTNASATPHHGAAIFFTKSNDGGKTFANTMVLSPLTQIQRYLLYVGTKV